MRITVEADVRDASQALLRLSVACVKPAPILKWMGALTVKYLKTNAGAHSFAPRAPETEAAEQGVAAQRRADRGIKRLRGKLRGDLRRAIRRNAGEDARMRRYLALKEFERLVNGGLGGESLADAKTTKALVKRIARGVADAQNRPILGRLPYSHRATVTGNQLDVASPVAWAGVQNDGGTAGHGAKIPERQWLAWWPPLMPMLAEIPGKVAIKAFEGE